MTGQPFNDSFDYGVMGGWTKQPKSLTVLFTGCNHYRSVKNDGRLTRGKTTKKVGSGAPRVDGLCPTCAKRQRNNYRQA